MPSPTTQQGLARTAIALGALALRYFALVSEGNNAGATEVRRAFTTIYLTRGGRAALIALGAPVAALPSTVSASGWSTNLRTAFIGALAYGTDGTGASADVLRGMPTAFASLASWWRSGAGAALTGGVRINTLDVLMELEAASTQAALLAAVDAFVAGPGLPIADPWVDQIATQSAQQAADAIMGGSAPSPAPTTVPRSCHSGFVSVNGQCVASVEAGGDAITGQQFTVTGRTAGEFPLWAVLLLTGIGVGGVTWVVLAKGKKRRRRR